MWSRFVMSQVKHNSYFIMGMMIGLWVSLSVIPLEEEGAAPCAAALAAAAPPDEFEPHREERPPSADRAAARSLQRPRYYSTELGMRGSLLTGVLTSEAELKEQVPLLNQTLALLQPALKFFITASAVSSVPGLANVVGFTDTREMLKPFHALKYLADNYLEEYDFFFLVSDGAYVNARRLARLVARLSVSRDLYMGEPVDDGQYCSLEGGILLSNSVLRAVHGELEWCVRNSYSPHHHENLGRCVLHAAHTPCAAAAQGQRYEALRLEGAGADGTALAAAVSARPARGAALLRLHAGAAAAQLRRDRAEAAHLRAYMWRNSARHPAGYRNSTWPGGLRADPGLAAAAPADRHEHLRWTPFNATHALLADELRAAAPLAPAAAAAARLVADAAAAWALRRWPAAAAAHLLEGAWRWEPAVALRYKLLLRLSAADGAATLRQVEVVRGLGAARLVAVPYVTESARVRLVVGVGARAAAEALALLARLEAAEPNVHLTVALVGNSSALAPLRPAVAALAARRAGLVDLLPVEAPPDAELDAEPSWAAELRAAGLALRAAAARAPPDALLLLAPPHLDFNQDFLNRVRMNTIAGHQWFSPLPFARHSQTAHPRWAGGARPAVHTGRFRTWPAPLLAVYRADYEAAMAAWRGAPWDAAAALARSPLHCVRAPEPGAVLAPRAAPCPAPQPAGRAACLRALRAAGVAALELGARTQLAQLLLETQAEAD